MAGGCIYLTNSKEILTYNGAEHIIPAGLGGIKKLPKGSVSDEANRLFSKRETIALRETFLSINRNNNGPGKRGSDQARKTNCPRIGLFEVQPDQRLDETQLDAIHAPVRLGFLFYGEVQMISQILFPIRPDRSFKWPRITTGTISLDEIMTTDIFVDELKTFLKKPDKEPQKDYIIVRSEIVRADNYFLLGYHNHMWYVNTSLADKFILQFFKVLENKPLPESIPVLLTTKAVYHYNMILPKVLDDSFEFIYVKTAFNVLAYLKGADYVRNKQFNEIREAIVDGRKLFDYSINHSMPQWLVKWVQREVKLKSHFVIIHGHDQLIEAYVSFYREPLNTSICLSRNFKGEEFKGYYICNYKEHYEKHGILCDQ